MKIINKVTEPNTVVLTKPFIVVYNPDLTIILTTTNNIETYPGVGTMYAEFDSQEELEQFITDNELITEPSDLQG